MYWSAVPFGKYQGKTLVEIVVQDPDWFFWMVPKLYGKLGRQAQDLARKSRPSKFRNLQPTAGRSNIATTAISDFEGLNWSEPAALFLADGRPACRTWI